MNAEEKVEMLRGTLNSAGWQKIIKPALQGAINNAANSWETGKRPKGEESLTDEGLKQRIVALRWVQGWEQTYAKLVEQVDAMNEYVAQTEPANDGVGPYEA